REGGSGRRTPRLCHRGARPGGSGRAQHTGRPRRRQPERARAGARAAARRGLPRAE
ncbi:unnamed protein product, partial [Prorocentrum cordatum]